MKHRKMDYEKIMIICGIVTLISGGITIWARIQKNNESKIQNIKNEKRIIITESAAKENKDDINDLKTQVEQLKNFVQEQRQVALNYSDFSKDEQEQLLKDKFNYSSDELEALISKAKHRTDSYISNALAYDFENDNLNAIKYYNKALEETTLNSQKAWILFSIGEQYFNLQNDKEAIRYYNMSIDFYDKVNEKSDEDFVILGYIYNGLGKIDRKNSNYITAIKNHEKALKIRKDLVSINHDKHILELSMSYNNLAVVYKRVGDLEKFIDYNKRAIKIRRELFSKSNRPFDTFYLARSLNNLSNAYSDKGNYNEAKIRIEEAIDLFLTLNGSIDKISYEENLANFYINYGRILYSLNNYKSSIQTLEEAIGYYKSLIEINRAKYINAYAGALHNLGNVYRDLNELDKAITTFSNAIEVKTEIEILGDSDINLADIYYNLAMIYFVNKPNKELALHNFNKAYDIYVKYPQSVRAKEWSEKAVKRMDYLRGL